MDYIKRVILRKEAQAIAGEPSWLMIYGRRKTGKTFLLRKLCKFNNYFLIKRNLSILSDNKINTASELVERVRALLQKNDSVVIDEFQRLDESVLEEIVQEHPKGKLVLCGSSMKIIKKFFDSKSPLLGFFTPIKIKLIRPSDILNGLKEFDYSRRIELSTFLVDPWLIPLVNKQDIIQFMYETVTKSKYIISSLIGEIFTEEERELTKKYECILSLIGAGIWNTKEITNILYSRDLIPDMSQTHVIQYLKNLEEMQLVEAVRMYKSKNKYFYRLYSPIMNVYYYLDDRYNISNREVSLEEVKPTFERLIDLEIQNFIANLFADKFSGRKEYFVSSSKEIDFIITKRNKPIIVGEVKWKKVSKRDIEKFKKSSAGFRCRKILITKNRVKSKDENKDIEILDAKSICEDL